MVVCVVAVRLAETDRDIWSESKSQTKPISDRINKNALFASLACLFQSVSSVLLCEGQVLPLLHRRSKHLEEEKKALLNTLLS